jgi:electron transfer flavoprotein beta subunit
MKIFVCLKLIADPDIVEFDIIREELRRLYPVLDPIGSTVLEEGLALKERFGGEVIALSVAPEPGNAILRQALLYGADRAIRIWHEELRDADTWLAAQVLKQALNKNGFDLVLCGTRSQDNGSGFMTSALASSLNIASASGIIGLEVGKDKRLTAHKKMAGGQRETCSLELPAILGLEEGLNEPRYVAPFSRAYRSGMSREIEFTEADLEGLKGRSLTRVVRYTQSRPRTKVGINISALSMQEKLKMMRGELGRKREIFEGRPEEAARKIYTCLNDVLK